MDLKFSVAFSGRQVEKRMFPYRKPTADITLPCPTALACDSFLSFWLGYPYFRRILWDHRGEWPPHPKKGKIWKAIAQKALPYVKPRLLGWRALNLVYGFGVYKWLRKKRVGKKLLRIGTRPLFFTGLWGLHRLYDLNQIWHGCLSAWRYHPSHTWEQSIHYRDF